MKKDVILIFSILIFSNCFGQDDTKVTPPIRLAGPRMGVTYITPGELSQTLKDRYNANPLITQFGWQFETRYFTLSSGTAGLVEGVILMGGLEQGLFLPSGNLLLGLRNAKGLEFGLGPNFSLSGAAFVFAIGYSFKSENINFPINLAVVPSREGLRLSLLAGFNARHH